jgi:hypothetical protein
MQGVRDPSVSIYLDLKGNSADLGLLPDMSELHKKFCGSVNLSSGDTVQQ